MYGEIAEAKGGVWVKAGFLEAEDLYLMDTCDIVELLSLFGDTIEVPLEDLDHKWGFNVEGLKKEVVEEWVEELFPGLVGVWRWMGGYDRGRVLMEWEVFGMVYGG